jgi:hypothetical protein
MAINFPDSPTLNQEFTVGDRVWFWNGTVWKSKETPILETGKYVVSDTAPENPEEGDAWFDSVNTKEFIYYDGYWVETSAAAIGIPATGLATEAYVDNAVSGIVDSAPAVLDTLNELAAAIGDDANFITTVNNNIDTKKTEINQLVSSDITLEAGYRYFIDTSTTRTLSLPATPALGQEIVLVDANNLAATNNVTVNNNGEKIDGIAEGILIDVSAFVVNFIYTGSSYGWRMI